jgi:hypothetical protein
MESFCDDKDEPQRSITTADFLCRLISTEMFREDLYHEIR